MNLIKIGIAWNVFKRIYNKEQCFKNLLQIHEQKAVKEISFKHALLKL